jgi:hypothetical protein
MPFRHNSNRHEIKLRLSRGEKVNRYNTGDERIANTIYSIRHEMPEIKTELVTIPDSKIRHKNYYL